MLLQPKCIQSTFAALNAAIKLLRDEVGMFHGWIKFSSKQIERGISNKLSLFHCIRTKKKTLLRFCRRHLIIWLRLFAVFSALFWHTVTHSIAQVFISVYPLKGCRHISQNDWHTCPLSTKVTHGLSLFYQERERERETTMCTFNLFFFLT